MGTHLRVLSESYPMNNNINRNKTNSAYAGKTLISNPWRDCETGASLSKQSEYDAQQSLT